MSEFKEEIERLTNWYNECFSEEKRNQRLIDQVVYEEKQKSKKELEKVLKEMK